MKKRTETAIVNSHREAVQALGLMTTSLLVVALIGLDGTQAVLGIVAFCIALMIAVAGTLFLIEGRVHAERPTPLLRFCLPAVGVLGFSIALFAAAGLWTLAALVCGLAFGFSAYRRSRAQGNFNLIPLAALDLGLAGGIGASTGGVMLILVNAVAG